MYYVLNLMNVCVKGSRVTLTNSESETYLAAGKMMTIENFSRYLFQSKFNY
jgi:hypothetical protein